MSDRSEKFLRVAQEMGLLTDAQIHAAHGWMRAAAAHGIVADLSATLEQHGFLTADQIRDVHLEVRSGKTDFVPAEPTNANVTLLDLNTPPEPSPINSGSQTTVESNRLWPTDEDGLLRDLGTTDFDGKYLLGDVVGAGGVGEIRLGIDKFLRREVAIKSLLQPDHPGHRYRFVREAQITGQLEHPNIVPIHEMGNRPNGQIFFAMKFVRGRTLEAVLDEQRQRPEGGALPLGDLLDIFTKICDAVGYAHSRGVIHRDLKPQNVMIGEFGEVLVMDWGLAVRKGAASESGRFEPVAPESLHANTGPLPIEVSAMHPGSISDTRTLDGTVIGTPAYMSPEQARGEIANLDERTDIYSLGAILYEMLTLSPPVSGPNLSAILRAVEAGEIVPPSQRTTAQAIPKVLESVVLKALARRPLDRYANVRELLNEMRQNVISGRLQDEVKLSKPIASVELAVMLSINRTSRMMLETLDRKLVPYGVRPAQYNIMRMLTGAKETGLDLAGIRDRMVGFDPNIDASLAALVEFGYCRHVPGTADGPARWIVTEKGVAFTTKTSAEVGGKWGQLGVLPEHELRQLMAMLDRLRESMAE